MTCDYLPSSIACAFVLRQVEIEKYVDQAYSRDNEAPTPWQWHTISKSDAYSLPQFYRCKDFKLFPRTPIDFPEYLLVSNNYFGALSCDTHLLLYAIIQTIE